MLCSRLNSSHVLFALKKEEAIANLKLVEQILIERENIYEDLHAEDLYHLVSSFHV